MDRQTLGATLALCNALLNGAAALLLFLGWLAIRRRRPALHRRLMTGAFAVSCLFLVTYLCRVALTGTHRYPGVGLARTLYLIILTSHTLLATLVPPLALRSLYLARRQRYLEHKRIVRFTWPIWMYVSVTGVAVYLLLYHPL